MFGSSYKARMRWAMALAMGGSLAVGLVAGQIVRQVQPGENFWVIFPLLLLAATAIMLAPMPWWNRLDDVQKHGHYVSWYWGGLAGALVMLMWLVAGAGPQSDAARGALALFLGQSVGFIAAFAIWWWRGRGPVE